MGSTMIVMVKSMREATVKMERKNLVLPRVEVAFRPAAGGSLGPAMYLAATSVEMGSVMGHLQR